ncbi:MAG: hypothetical protein Fur0032_12280 [Terrimicrobiaceae bacterium]
MVHFEVTADTFANILDGGRIDMTRGIFSSNVSDGLGGALEITGSTGTAMVSNTQFLGNDAEYGGGMHVAGSPNLNFRASKLVATGNSAALDGGGIDFSGDANLELLNPQIRSNVAGNRGGGVDGIPGTLPGVTGNFAPTGPNIG